MSAIHFDVARETLALTEAAIAACHYVDAVHQVAELAEPAERSAIAAELVLVRGELRAHLAGTAAIEDLEELHSLVKPLARMKIRAAKRARIAMLIAGCFETTSEAVEPTDLTAVMASLVPLAMLAVLIGKW